MQLPGRLRLTTLGDLLGTLHRAGASGTLELVEDRGRAHRVHVSSGLVTSVEIDGASPTLSELLKSAGLDEATLRRALLRSLASRRLVGEVLARDFRVSPDVIDGALRAQLALRLRVLETLEDARVSFRVAVRPPREALHDRPLEPSEFLHSRRRARDRVRAPASGDAHHRSPRVACGESDGAYALLGVDRDADATEIRRAFRRLARELHPDRHPHASEPERRALAVKFAQVAAAYQALVA
ncbi:MAG TPA: J domain-containing protein [Polyangiaceae bacterium]|jgi:DnaJ-domain-containing protein 1